MHNDYCLELNDGTYRVDKNITTSIASQQMEEVTFAPVDPMHPEQPVYTGTVLQTVTVSGRERRFAIYIPKTCPISGPSWFVFPKSGTTASDFLKSSSFTRLSEEQRVTLVVLESTPYGWDEKNIGDEMAYAEAVFAKANSRNYVGLNEATYYTIGLGEGAYISTAYAILNSSSFSAIAEDGNFGLRPELLEQLKTIRSDRNALQNKTDVPIAAWFSDPDGSRAEEKQAVIRTFLSAAKAEDRGLETKQAHVFQQNFSRIQNNVNRSPIIEVLVTDHDRRIGENSETLHSDMVQFGLRFKKWLCVGNGEYRPARTAEDMGLIRFEKIIDGRKREWYLYVPSSYRLDPGKPRPAVIGLHGYSNTGIMFAESSDWHVVAEKRDFFVLYPTAFPCNMATGENSVPLPTWNSLQMHSDSDDVRFILEMLKETEHNYPIDPERVFVVGHSNGALMTHRLMQDAPLIFAGFGPQACQFHFSLDGKRVDNELPDDGIIRPVWLIVGHEDVGDQDSMEPGSTNVRFLDMMCRVNHLDRQNDSILQNGKYTTHTFCNSRGVPLVKFSGVMDLPHCYMPDMANLVWDEFFCHLRRKKDGSVQYTF
jgi:poly(3-hydroxybutyrate) depolymerase